MKKGYSDGIIISNTEISPNIYQLILSGDFQGQPGQFYMVRGWNGLDPLLPRPISIADSEEGYITLLYEVRGKGTHIISTLNMGDKLSLLGPLGNEFEAYENKRIALVSGGIGIAPMLYLSKTLHSKPDIFLGFRNHIYLLDKLLPYAENIYISTEEGTFGYKGYIVDIFQPENYDLVISCGPIGMMKALVDKCRGIVPVQISMEGRMACGIGACLGCTIETIRGMEKVCKEGPVFIGEEVFSWVE